MDLYGSQITKLIEELSALPGVGAKSAQRLARGAACTDYGECAQQCPLLLGVLCAYGFGALPGVQQYKA